MKIAVINGNMRHGSTWNCVREIISELQKLDQTDVAEFFLPKDLPHFCNGCFSCIYNGESTCPHRSFVEPIVHALNESDLIILASPVYGFDVSGQMKSLIDHLCYMWISHRPEPKMFDKVALAVTTSAGAGLNHTLKTLKNSLTFWGIKKVYTFKFPVSAMKWSDVTDKKRTKIAKEARKLAAKITKSANNIQRSPDPLFRNIFFKMMAGMQKKNNWNKTDRDHWEKLGWLDGSKPF